MHEIYLWGAWDLLVRFVRFVRFFHFVGFFRLVRVRFVRVRFDRVRFDRVRFRILLIPDKTDSVTLPNIYVNSCKDIYHLIESIP